MGFFVPVTNENDLIQSDYIKKIEENKFIVLTVGNKKKSILHR